ncbi:hypothetical protein ABQE69_10815 [Mycolicibacillus trivialis]|uniref:hypothetical protein n=1 Tax=Mycobacteroides abscessus TaxID=36809 RepID=UPI0009A7CBC7|nr:hypothetical protein [Mycobacteroides abscessus]SLG53540.1 Uncharacterised protein [Mycobacteroides abscessus subsp. massiliense]SLH95525.1 Uncharacterised protein [Mycobacteroides abscessus subsp. massiliense]
MTVPVETSTATAARDTPPWDDIAAAVLWRAGTADCGCPLYRHHDDHADDHLGGGAPATLHEFGRCTDGRREADLDPRLARHIGIPVPEGAATVTVDRATLAGALRGIPADGALTVVKAERAAEAVYTEAGIAAIDAHLAATADGTVRTYTPEPTDDVTRAWAATADPYMPGAEALIDRAAHWCAAQGYAATAESLGQALERRRENAAVNVVATATATATPEDAVTALPALRRAVTEAEAIARRRDSLTEIPASIRGYMTHDALWAMTPALARIKTDAERNGVSPWAQLGAALARVSASIPTWVRLVPETGSPNGAGGANVDLYVVLSGPGGSGKSVVIKAGRGYCDADAHGFAVGATPTGEGLNKHLLEMEAGTTDADGEFAPSRRIWNPSFLIEEGEGENFTKMALQRDSTILGQLRAHWGGDQAGKPTADPSRRTTIDGMWARVATLLILHPEICTTLLMQVGNGSSARFVWLPAYRTGPAQVTDEAETPFQLPRYGARHFVEGDGVAPAIGSLMPPTEKPDIVWIRQPAAMRRAMDLEGVRAFADPTAITEASDLEARKMHDMLQRFKLSTVLSAMDGIVQPEDVHWDAATEIVAVSHRVQTELLRAVHRVTEIAAEDKGKELAITDVTRNAERDALTDSDVQEAAAAIIATLGRKPMPRAELRDKVRSMSRAAARGYGKALGQLQACGAVVDAGRGQPLQFDRSKLEG